LFEKSAKVGNISSYTLSQTFLASSLHQGFSNFWCYGAHEEIDHNLRSPTKNFQK